MQDLYESTEAIDGLWIIPKWITLPVWISRFYVFKFWFRLLAMPILVIV
jgi:hypothetical protein